MGEIFVGLLIFAGLILLYWLLKQLEQKLAETSHLGIFRWARWAVIAVVVLVFGTVLSNAGSVVGYQPKPQMPYCSQYPSRC